MGHKLHNQSPDSLFSLFSKEEESLGLVEDDVQFRSILCLRLIFPNTSIEIILQTSIETG
jgi:hypothetical protein